MWKSLALQTLVAAVASPLLPPDTSMKTLPVAYYGARWLPRSDALIENMSRLSVVILMQEDGVCWTHCCPDRGKPGGHSKQCGPLHNASSFPGCDSHCDQEGTQNTVFLRLKEAAAKAGRRGPHCVLYANAVYLWPFDFSNRFGPSVQVLDVHGRPHMETAGTV